MQMKVKEGWVLTPEQTKIFYTTKGNPDSKTAIVFCNGIGVEWQSFWPGISRELAKYYWIVHWDYRGHGRSELAQYPEKVDIPTCARDLRKVMKEVGIDKAVIVGHSMGSQVLLEFYRLFPECVEALIPVLGTYEHPLNTFLNFKHSARLFEILSKLALKNPVKLEKLWPFLFEAPLAQRFARKTGLIHSTMCPWNLFDLYLNHLRIMSPVLFMNMAVKMQMHSASDILESIQVPTLIFAGENDIMTPLEASKEMQRRIPLAELQVISQGTHTALVEQPDLFWLRIHYFLQSRLGGTDCTKSSQSTTQSKKKKEVASAN